MSLDRRKFLQTTTAGVIGAGLSWRFGGKTAWGQIPWETHKESVLLTETDELDLSDMIKLGKGIKNEYPCSHGFSYATKT